MNVLNKIRSASVGFAFVMTISSLTTNDAVYFTPDTYHQQYLPDLGMSVLSEPKKPLGGGCSAGDVCRGDNSECVDGVCRCKPLFYEDLAERTCSKTMRKPSVKYLYIPQHN